ncbi:uncharacterized protein [Hyperolius riggenbachi]|uniref:uncharacterized protein n=1 Tax=Hyperolius riggenbachi TaxID=752182 RepID=UPI0035A3B61C
MPDRAHRSNDRTDSDPAVVTVDTWEEADAENCQKCPDDEWPNEAKNQCVPKSQEFLSLHDDVALLFIILSGHKMTAPNYSCMEHGIVAGFIGDLQSATTLRMAQLLNVYGYTLVSYGARDTLLSDRRLFPNFFRTVPDNQVQHEAIVKLLEAFKWNWVGIVTSDDEYGERELQQLSKHLANCGICLEFKVLISDQNKIPREFQVSTTEIFSVNGMEEFFSKYVSTIHKDDPLHEDIMLNYYFCPSGNKLKNSVLTRSGVSTHVDVRCEEDDVGVVPIVGAYLEVSETSEAVDDDDDVSMDVTWVQEDMKNRGAVQMGRQRVGGGDEILKPAGGSHSK